MVKIKYHNEYVEYEVEADTVKEARLLFDWLLGLMHKAELATIQEGEE